MRASLLGQLTVSGALFLAFATSSAHAQVAFSSGLQQGGDLAAGQMRSWAFNVPAGNYLAIARVSYVLRSGQDSGGLECQLKRMNTDEFWDYQEASITGTVQTQPVVEGEITLMSQVPVTAAGSLVIQCRASGGQTGAQRVQDVRLELIRVRVLETLTPIDTSGPAAPVTDPRNNAGTERRNN